MTQVLRNVLLLLLIAISVAAQPTISSISPTTASRSGRLLIQGSGFGVVQGSGHVTIAGLAAPVTRWSDTLIAAYVPEASVLGADGVQVFNSQGAASNLVVGHGHLSPTPDWTNPLAFSSGRRLHSRTGRPSQLTAPYTRKMCTVTSMLSTPTGGLKWIFNGSGGAISVGQDGTIYVGSTTSIFALAPDGTLKWQFNQNPSAFLLLGPNVGPDGNIYAVGTQGMGVFSLTPQGEPPLVPA